MTRLYWHVGDVIRARQQRAVWCESDRPAFARSAAGVPRHGWFVVEKPSVHAHVRRRVVGAVNHASAACAIDLVPPCHAARQAGQECRAPLVRRARRGARLVAQHPRAADRRPAPCSKDPYLFDFLGTAEPRQEHEIEASLVAHVERFLLELGSGFAFVGRQVPLEVGGDDFKLDLLFYHFKLRRFVVVELKAVKFDPGMVSQLHMCLSAVDAMLKQPDDQPTIGLLLCRGKNELVVEYALRDQRRPMGVADWEPNSWRSCPTRSKELAKHQRDRGCAGTFQRSGHQGEKTMTRPLVHLRTDRCQGARA
jgi:hypothetical protein